MLLYRNYLRTLKKRIAAEKPAEAFPYKMPFEKHIYISKYPDADRDNYWISFESDPRLTKTKKDIYGKCLPCIQNLYYQLQQRKSEITLAGAFDCWKIVAVLHSMDECLELLQRFEESFLRGHVYGKMGSGRPKSPTRVVVFHTESEKERDRIYHDLQICALQVHPEAKVFISRACAVLYEDILGDWRTWKRTSQIIHPKNVPKILERIRKTLYYSKM